MTEVLHNPATKRLLDGFLTKPTHALMLNGPYGAGKGYVAKYIASQLLEEELNRIDTHPYTAIITPEKNTISIDSIREIRKFLSLKVPGEKSIRRILIVENAHTMTIEAQNAILKSLEEPPQDTVIIMTVADRNLLLPTILSRVQAVDILPISEDQIKVLGGNEKQRSIASGRPGLLHAMLNDEENSLIQSIGLAKEFLTKSTYERLAMSAPMKDRSETAQFLQSLMIVSSAALRSALKNNDNKQIAAWQKRMKHIFGAQKQLSANCSIKLLLTDLSLGL